MKKKSTLYIGVAILAVLVALATTVAVFVVRAKKKKTLFSKFSKKPVAIEEDEEDTVFEATVEPVAEEIEEIEDKAAEVIEEIKEAVTAEE